MRLSAHFRLREFTRSDTAQRKGIDNTPTEGVISNLQLLCREVLEPLREHAGQPIIICSGYRSPLVNKAVGGSTRSQHMTGEAADIMPPDEDTGKQWFLWMMDNLHFDQLIWECSGKPHSRHWIHVSFRHGGHQRQHVIQNLVKT